MTTPQGMKMLMLVHEDLASARSVAAIAARGGWRTVFAQGLSEAINALDTRDGSMLDAVLLDGTAAAPEERADFLARMQSRRPELPILYLIAGGDEAEGGKAIRGGATDYIPAPPTNESLLGALDAFLRSNTRHDLRPLSEKLPLELTLETLVGSTPDFRNMVTAATKAASGRMPVLIEGEKGCGKETLARAIHTASSRADGPFITLHCATLSEAMVGSALFGHERNAFPGAFDHQLGKLHQAAGGTLFIDEIETLPLEVQQRLVYTIATGEILTIGGSEGKPLRARIIAAADTPLRPRMAAGYFREDLYFRLAAQTIVLPNLRSRKGDIPALAQHFLGRIEKLPGIGKLELTDEAMGLMGSYPWPGNVRQLQSTLLRAALACASGTLSTEDFPDVAAAVANGTPAEVGNGAIQPDIGGITLFLADGNLRPLEDIEADVIRLAIGHYRGRMTEVARRLGIGRSTLYRKLADLGIDSAA